MTAHWTVHHHWLQAKTDDRVDKDIKLKKITVLSITKFQLYHYTVSRVLLTSVMVNFVMVETVISGPQN